MILFEIEDEHIPLYVITLIVGIVLGISVTSCNDAVNEKIAWTAHYEKAHCVH